MLTRLAGVCYTTRLLDLGLFLWMVAVPENAYSEHLRRMERLVMRSMSLWCLDLERGEALLRITIHNVELRVSMY